MTYFISAGSYVLYTRGFEGRYLSTYDLAALKLFNLNALPGTAPLAALFYPGYFMMALSILYGSAALTLIGGRRFDVAFDWFNRKFDIEKKPLSAIGLVAGSLVVMSQEVVHSNQT